MRSRSGSKEQPADPPEARGRFSRVGSSELVLGIVQQIDDRIARGELVPGQRLVEADLMEEHGVGRMPVREALRILAGDGVVELSPNRGARIRALDVRRLIEMLETLTGLFGVAMRLFAERSNHVPEAVAAVRAQRDRIKAAAASASPVDIMEEMIAFHEVLTRWSGNDYLNELIARIHIRHYSRQLALSSTPAQMKAVAGAYDRLTEALVSGDHKAAADLIGNNLETLSAALLRGEEAEDARRYARSA